MDLSPPIGPLAVEPVASEPVAEIGEAVEAPVEPELAEEVAVQDLDDEALTGGVPDEAEPTDQPVAFLPDGGSFVIADEDHEIAVGEGGVMLAQAGYYIVTDGDGIVSAMPPARFIEAYPEFAPADEAEA